MRTAALAIASVAVALAVPGPAQATRVTFVLLSGKHAGERIKTDGGPKVPARLNHRRISGKLIPQFKGNEFTFRGKVRAGSAQAADNTTAAASPAFTLSPLEKDLVNAISHEVDAADVIKGTKPRKDFASDIKKAKNDLNKAKGELTKLGDAYKDLIGKLDKAQTLDDAAAKSFRDAGKQPLRSKKRAALEKDAADDLDAAMAEKRAVGSALNDRSEVDPLKPAEPPTTQVDQPPYPLPEGTATAINLDSTVVLGTQDAGSSGSTAWLFSGSTTIFGQSGTALNAFGPAGSAGGSFGGDAIFLPPPFRAGENPILLPVSSDVLGGDVRGGSKLWFVGFVNLSHAPVEQAAAWKKTGSSGSRARASALRFKGFKVGKFAGGSSLFTVSSNLAFGDHFDHGISGRFRAFRLDLRKRVKTELFRPHGGSSQPLASNRAGVGAGGSKFANGALEATYWWGSKHYLRFGTGSYVAGMNDAGVGVGVIGPAANQHAALFEHGKAYDLNTLIPSGSGWTLTKATAISNAGVVVGTGIRGGVQRGFVLNLSAKRS